jgi:hypothetical protein
MPSHLHHMISAGRRDFATYLPLPPLSLTRGPGQARAGATRFGPREVVTLGAWHEET